LKSLQADLCHISPQLELSSRLLPLHQHQINDRATHSTSIDNCMSLRSPCSVASISAQPPELCPSTAMETVLSTPELLLYIFSYFLPDQLRPLEVKSDRETLLRLATTNFAFNRASIPYLWSYMTSAIPVLLLLPSFTKVDNQWVSNLLCY